MALIFPVTTYIRCVQEVSAHKACKKELAAARKELESLSAQRDSVQHLEQQVKSLQATNAQLAADAQQRPGGATEHDEPAGAGGLDALKLQQKVQLQAVELIALRKSLVDKDGELVEMRHRLQRLLDRLEQQPAPAERAPDHQVCHPARLRQVVPSNCKAQQGHVAQLQSMCNLAKTSGICKD